MDSEWVDNRMDGEMDRRMLNRQVDRQMKSFAARQWWMGSWMKG